MDDLKSWKWLRVGKICGEKQIISKNRFVYLTIMYSCNGYERLKRSFVRFTMKEKKIWAVMVLRVSRKIKMRQVQRTWPNGTFTSYTRYYELSRCTCTPNSKRIHFSSSWGIRYWSGILYYENKTARIVLFLYFRFRCIGPIRSVLVSGD